MTRFKDIVIHEDSETVDIGAGLTWMEVYSYIVPKGINVVGARCGPVGVSGYTLGGGKQRASVWDVRRMPKSWQDILSRRINMGSR
jgi:hypothetical protein